MTNITIQPHQPADNNLDTVDPLVMRQRQMAYLEAIKPFLDRMTKIYSLTTPTIIIRPDGEIEHKYNFSPDQEEALRLANEVIEMVKTRIFGA
jgi:hypothetical protein